MSKFPAIDFSEDLRQQECIARLRAHFEGKDARYFIQTYGCQMNENDSEKIAGMLEEAGITRAESPEDADIVFMNTCCVREHAEVKVYTNVGSLRARKEADPDFIICICGCMMQQEGMAENLVKRFPFVNLIFGTHQLRIMPELLWNAVCTGRPVISTAAEEGSVIENIPVLREESCKAWVSIMYGCDNFCSYCIVPYVRGRERSRTPGDILNEVRCLAARGVKEITLLGQNVNSYGKWLDEKVDFADLLRMVHEVEGIERIRFMTSHPKDLSDKLIRAMAELPKVCHHLHLPVQSGSTRVLKLMNRRYTRENYLNLVHRIREAIPDISLTTDIIVGFPQETEADFEDTLSLVREVRFDAAFTFAYSVREGTPAAVMEDQIPLAEKKDRLRRLNEVEDVIFAENNAACMGETLDVLVDSLSSRDAGEVSGKTSTNRTVHMKGDASLIGQIVKVRITQVKVHTLTGEIVR